MPTEVLNRTMTYTTGTAISDNKTLWQAHATAFGRLQSAGGLIKRVHFYVDGAAPNFRLDVEWVDSRTHLTSIVRGATAGTSTSNNVTGVGAITPSEQFAVLVLRNALIEWSIFHDITDYDLVMTYS